MAKGDDPKDPKGISFNLSPESKELLQKLLVASSTAATAAAGFPGLTLASSRPPDPKLDARMRELEDQITELRRRSSDQTQALQKEQISAKEQRVQIATLEQTLQELEAKEKLGFVLSRVNDEAKKRLLESPEFRAQFLQTRECEAVVMAVDIRRSTDLMLKARTPEDFARFITSLCRELMTIVVDSGGVFDKFTGDGVLAFYPDFYSGPDAMYRAVAAADDCHAAFKRHYRSFRKSFTSVLTDVGLGIGIDFGKVHLVQVAGGLTVVGGPVVYACRLSGAPSNTTLANQPAFEVLGDKSMGAYLVAERELEIKHEGMMLAYAVKLNARDYVAEMPAWMQPTEESAQAEQASPKLAVASGSPPKT